MTLQTSAPAGAGAGTIGEDLNAVTPQVSADSPGANARATGETSSLVPDPALLAACRGRRLVVLIGAGCSLMPPTSLPSWNKINEAVLDALVARSTQSENSTDNVVRFVYVAICNSTFKKMIYARTPNVSHVLLILLSNSPTGRLS